MKRSPTRSPGEALAEYKREILDDIRRGLSGLPVRSGRWTYRTICTAVTENFCRSQRELDQLWCRAEFLETTWRWLNFPSGWWVKTHVSNWLTLRHGLALEIVEGDDGDTVVSWRIVRAEVQP